MSDLTAKTCTPCKGGIPPLSRQEAENYQQNTPQWELSEDDRKISRSFKFGDYRQTLDFVNSVTKLVEEENHHPEICFGYSNCRIEIYTHKIKGLHENDFILAAKIDELLPD